MAPTPIGSITLVKVEFWHKDHLGSLVATTDHTGAVTARYAYDPFGKRRTASGNYDASGNLVYDWNSTSSGTDRGYTGHEHLDDIGIIHMNGRLYDPTLGIFMQGDPFVQDPMNLQNYNRYGYRFNNPLTCTDPSGYFSLQKWIRQVFIIGPFIIDPIDFLTLRGVARSKIGNEIASIAISLTSAMLCNIWAPVCNGFGQAILSGFAGHSFSESIRSGFIAGAASYALQLAGDAFPGAGDARGSTTLSRFENTVAHAVIGCASSEASGGTCKSGAIASGVSAAYGNQGPGYIDGNGINAVVGNTVISAFVGGAASSVSGGSFADGAKGGAAGYLFNELIH